MPRLYLPSFFNHSPQAGQGKLSPCKTISEGWRIAPQAGHGLTYRGFWRGGASFGSSDRPTATGYTVRRHHRRMAHVVMP